jgi:hypothetical protein
VNVGIGASEVVVSAAVVVVDRSKSVEVEISDVKVVLMTVEEAADVSVEDSSAIEDEADSTFVFVAVDSADTVNVAEAVSEEAAEVTVVVIAAEARIKKYQ